MKKLGKTLILGDSYSTFLGSIPEGYDYWYSTTIHPEHKVTAPEHTWWYQAMERGGGELVLNCSWSGTTVCHTGWRGEDCRHKSFAARLDALADGGFFTENKIDTVLILGATNDSWAGSPVGEIKYEGITDEDMYSFCPALSHMLARIVEVTPSSRVIYIVNTGLKPKITAAIVDACRHYGCESLLLPEVDKKDGHPTAQGMTEIADALVTYLSEN